MALGAMTKVDSYKVGNKRYNTYDIVLGTGANYPTGGETITPALAGMNSRILDARGSLARLTSDGSTARTLGWDFATTARSVKMQVYTTGSAEAANGADLSTFSARVTFVGQ